MDMRRPLLLIAFCAAVFATLGMPAAVSAATLVDRNPEGNRVSLKVNRNNVALLEYRSKGRAQRVLAWGAINVSHDKMRLDYSGGWGSKVADWRTFRNTCTPFDPREDETLGAAAELVVAACVAPDGSKWAVQTWHRLTPNYGGMTGANEIFISRWSGPVAQLQVEPNWSKYAARSTGEHYQHIFGTFTYRGTPIIVHRADARGNPLDAKGRNIYVDALDSTYRDVPGWIRVNAFLAQRPNGQFCYVFQPREVRDNHIHQIKEPWLTNARTRSGDSRKNAYRATVIGPGVTPLIRTYWQGMVGPFDRELQDQKAALSIALIGAGNKCAVQGTSGR